ncbi:MAG TPA: hypothetical protein VMD59_04135, partial [Acidimicrobiales bacterium]|nr:hypothetical protein [Acidimicrobiales bacterium]
MTRKQERTSRPGGSSPRTTLLVLGMHRSGTSAVAGALSHLGFAPPRPGDLMEHRPDNPRGHFESRSLSELDEAVLARLGGSWERPPALAEGFELDAALDDLAAAAPGVLDRAFLPTDSKVIWKDPRLSLVLPLWRLVLPAPLLAVLVLRDPLEVALSLAARNDLPLVKSVALWERYMRQAVRSVRGMPVLVVDYPAVTADAAGLAKGLDELLVGAGVEPEPGGLAAAGAFLDPDLRHERREDALQLAGSLLLPGQLELYEQLSAMAGAHGSFDAGDIGVESPWTTALLGLDQDLEHTFDGLMWAVGQLRPLLDIEPIETGRSEEFIRYGRRGPELSVDDADAAEPAPDSPYPLNASEDRRAYHR